MNVSCYSWFAFLLGCILLGNCAIEQCTRERSAVICKGRCAAAAVKNVSPWRKPRSATSCLVHQFKYLFKYLYLLSIYTDDDYNAFVSICAWLSSWLYIRTAWPSAVVGLVAIRRWVSIKGYRRIYLTLQKWQRGIILVNLSLTVVAQLVVLTPTPTSGHPRSEGRDCPSNWSPWGGHWSKRHLLWYFNIATCFC